MQLRFESTGLRPPTQLRTLLGATRAMNGKHVGLIAGLVIGTLFLANIAASFIRREERTVIPEAFRGAWTDREGHATIKVQPAQLFVVRNAKWYLCRAQAVTLYYDGPFLSYLFGKQKVAVECDKASTDQDQATTPFKAPDSYKKAYYFTMPDEWNEIHVEETVYMSKGYEGSEGVYTWSVGYFGRERLGT